MKRLSHFWVAAAFALLLCSLLAAPAVAQADRAEIQGLVADSSEAFVPGANVTLHNENFGVHAVRTTGDSGKYWFDSVDPGAYAIGVLALNFQFDRNNGRL